MGLRETGDIVRLAVFPLPGAILFPGLQLPLHIFEQRYRDLVGQVLVRNRRIGMIQPRTGHAGTDGPPPLYDVGCVGKIGEIEALDDGRYNLVLEGEARFKVVTERTTRTSFREIDAQLLPDPADEALASVERAGFEQEARRFADRQGYSVDWDAVERLDDVSLINGVSQIAPFDPAAKQALLEAGDVSERCELLIQLMQFFGHRDGGEDRVTLQ